MCRVLVLLVGCSLLVEPVPRCLAQAPAPTGRMTLTPAPSVSSWAPEAKAHPDQIIVINGSGFKADAFRVELVGPSGTLRLPIRSATSTKVEANVTEAMYTGTAGAKLVVYHAGGERRTLRQDYKVLQRAASFSGPSLWHETEFETSSIFTRGNVELRLDLLEFAESGSGVYSEVVELIERVQDIPVPAHCLLGGTAGAQHDWRSRSSQRQVQWSRLPDGRIEIKGFGIGVHSGPTDIVRKDAVATLADRTLRLTYSNGSGGRYTKPGTTDPHCNVPPSPLTPRPFVPVAPVPLRLVEWVLARQD